MHFTMKYYTRFLFGVDLVDVSLRYIGKPPAAVMLLHGPDGCESDLRGTGRRRRPRPEDVRRAHVMIWTAAGVRNTVIVMYYGLFL